MTMKHIHFSIVVLLLTVLISSTSWAALAPDETDQFNGQDAPDFSVQTLSGDTISLKAWRGHPVLLNFFASWCPPCRQEIADLMQFHARYAPKGLVIIGAATDAKLIPETSREKERKDVEGFVSRLKIPYAITIAEPDLLTPYHFKGIPTIVFITREGKIVKVFYGYHSRQQVEKVLKKIMADKKEK